MDIKSVAVKSTIGIIGVGGASIGGFYGIKALNKEPEKQIVTILEDSEVKLPQSEENIKGLLEKGGYTLLTSDSRNISTVLGNYKQAITNTSLKLENFDGNNDTGGKTASAILIEKCEALLKNTDTSNKADINKARRWCVEPTTIKDLLVKKNITPLNTTDDTNKPKWQQKIKEYNDSNNNQQPKIEGLDLSSSGLDTEDQKIISIKEKCSGLATKSNHEDKFEENLEAFKLWCA